jgi:hypothetical protein
MAPRPFFVSGGTADLPEGKVWRAVADVGGANGSYWWYEGYQVSSRRYVNSTVVER